MEAEVEHRWFHSVPSACCRQLGLHVENIGSQPAFHLAVTQIICEGVRFSCKMHNCVSGEAKPNIRLKIVKNRLLFLLQKFFFSEEKLNHDLAGFLHLLVKTNKEKSGMKQMWELSVLNSRRNSCRVFSIRWGAMFTEGFSVQLYTPLSYLGTPSLQQPCSLSTMAFERPFFFSKPLGF